MQLHIAHATINLHLAPSTIGLVEAFTELTAEAAQPSPAATTLTPPAAGEYWRGQGGYYICTQPAMQGLPSRHLIFGKDETEDLAFGPTNDIKNAGHQLDGASNTEALILAAGTHPAAEWAKSYTADGHADFHLPSRVDLLMAYVCAPELFQKSGWYWSSTQLSRDSAFVQDFEYGHSDWSFKDNEYRVRACRWVHLNA